MATEDVVLEEKVEGRSSRLMLVIGILAGLVVGGGGAWFATSQMMANSDDQAAEELVEEEAEEAAAEPTIAVVYLYVDRFQAPLRDERGRTVGYVFMDLALEMTVPEQQSYVSARLPRVQDAFLRAVSQNGLTVPGSNGIIDYDRVTKYLAKAGNDVLGGDYIKQIFIHRTLRAPS